MKPARIAFLLQLCLIACVAGVATPEQEMDAEAKKLFPTLFSRWRALLGDRKGERQKQPFLATVRARPGLLSAYQRRCHGVMFYRAGFSEGTSRHVHMEGFIPPPRPFIACAAGILSRFLGQHRLNGLSFPMGDRYASLSTPFS